MQKQAEVYQNSLAILVGKLPHKLDNLLSPQKHNIIRNRFNYNLQNLYNFPIDSIRNRPDVRIIERQLQAENALVGAAIAALYPEEYEA